MYPLGNLVLADFCLQNIYVGKIAICKTVLLCKLKQQSATLLNTVHYIAALCGKEITSWEKKKKAVIDAAIKSESEGWIGREQSKKT